jgi:hypothetical protein
MFSPPVMSCLSRLLSPVDVEEQGVGYAQFDFIFRRDFPKTGQASISA